MGFVDLLIFWSGFFFFGQKLIKAGSWGIEKRIFFFFLKKKNPQKIDWWIDRQEQSF